ncbi:ATP phosphoribosyltransferase [Aliikangiella coralliicola]|uniref:ATP phosphoribosyltransferase n=1 Tax=Aliikangiella coralliicola TaxID=2592383 RepID=A0A545UH04_9GAMM|nr:ATP phosphoribosyltransferase [Aliikangiella coralliicola]TQV88746.1 ATP phosphoribosyltransferase [Aliikangiella coralliicola]
MTLKLVLPKGRINTKVLKLLSDCGIELIGDERNYRPKAYGFDLEVKLLKSQNIPSLVELGQHDIGFAGLDWIKERRSEVVILRDLEFDPVKIVTCIPEDWDWQEMQKRKLIVASEYKNVSTDYLNRLGLDYQLLRSYGATEVFPPEDADMVIDNTSTGTTIRANRLKIVDTVMTSSTQFIANAEALEDPTKRQQIDDLLTLMQAVMNGRDRVLLEMNCANDQITSIVELLPAMRYPTVSRLYQEKGFAVKAAVQKSQIKDLLPKLIAAGATDILETPIRKAI